MKLYANILFKNGDPLDLELLDMCLKSLKPSVDGVVLLDTSAEPTESVALTARPDHPPLFNYLRDPDIIERGGFAAARNYLLQFTPQEPDTWILWVDSDEVHFDSLAQLRPLMEGDQYDEISTHFVHFCLGTNLYERMERRTNLFRHGPDIRWEGKVHEHLVRDRPARTFQSSYLYHHYGYVRSQEYVFSRWVQYAKLEGNPDPYKEEEVDGKVVPYFRPERPSPAHILDDRLKTLTEYHGEFPSAVPPQFVARHQYQL